MVKRCVLSVLSPVLSAATGLGALVFATTAALAGAFLDDEGTIRGVYIQGEGGYVHLPDQKANTFGPTGLTAVVLDFEESPVYGGQIGLVLPEGFRVEAEGMYVNADRAGFGAADSETEILLLMANVLYDMDVGDFPIRPYWGGGAGAALLDYNVATFAGAPFDDEVTAFAWQMTTGARVHATKALFLDVNYTYSRIRAPRASDFSAPAGGQVGLDIQRIGLHAVRGGLGVEF